MVAQTLQTGNPAVPAPPPPWRCPVLRDELKVSAGSANADGSPSWLIHDPLVNRFFTIGWLEFELLCVWHLQDATRMAQAVSACTPLHCTEADVRSLGQFLQQHGLVRADTAAGLARLQQLQAARNKSFWQFLLQNYLFFRWPLVRPVHGFDAMGPWLHRVPWRVCAALVVAVSAMGVYLVSRQWDVFTHTLLDSFTLEGMAGYLVALLLAKLFHELGHALVATYHGVRVGHMGVAFLVMFPMLYTDTGESWKLPSARHRLHIASAGILTELALGGLCAFLWAITPDGALRNGFFFLATTSWVLTVLLNASPFMRFDGYFILSDLLNFPNLHARSGALALTWWRDKALGLKAQWPERVAPRFRALLVAFATVTWVYRFIMYLGIALLVYVFFFKALGVFLMLVELHVFIVKPLLREMKLWWSAKALVPWRKRWQLLGFLGALLFVLAFPWRQSISVHGVLRAETSQVIYAPFAAQVLQITAQERVKQGDVLYLLGSRQYEIEAAKSEALSDSKRQQLSGLLGLEGGEGNRAVLTSELQRLQAEKSLATGELQRLVIRAPYDGVLRDRNADVRPGTWVASSTPLTLVLRPERWTVEAYVPEHEVATLAPGQPARVRLRQFPHSSLNATVVNVERSSATRYTHPLLEARHGGPLPNIESSADETHNPGASASKAFYRVVLAVQGVPEQQRIAAVQVSIEAPVRSYLGRVWRFALSLLIQEFAF